MANKLKLFVGSSVGGLNQARAVQGALQYDAYVRVWTNGIFRTGNYPIEDLIEALDDADFGAFIFLPEDVLILNRQNQAIESKVVRDNVLFELGMFMGRLGKTRAFIIKPRGHELHLPTDLAGINTAEFNDDPNLDAALGPPSYELLKMMKKAGAKTATKMQGPATPIGYDRQSTLAKAKQESKAFLHIRRCTRSDSILASGDVSTAEKFEDVGITGDEPVEQIPYTFTSRAGRSTDPRYESLTEGQSIRWKWSDTKPNQDERQGLLIFEPALVKGKPISYQRERTVISGIAFTELQRLEVTAQQEREESIRVAFSQIHDHYVYQLVFPEARFPKKGFRVTASDPNRKRDDQESAFAERQVTEFSATRTFNFNLPNPLPGYTYEINWELPRDKSESPFNAVESGFIEEMTRRLLALRTVDQSHSIAAHRALATSRERTQHLAGTDGDFEVTLYVYDRQKSALVCVASLDADIVEKDWEAYRFKPGRGIAGFAFRQLEVVSYLRPEASHPDVPDRYETVPGEDYETRPWILIAIPLFYAGHVGRSVGVLSLASRSKASALSILARDSGKLAQLRNELGNWYGCELAEALGVITSTKFWTAAAS